MLSSYIMITGTILNSDQLLLVETWDHLRETLILACAETTISCGNCNPHSDDVLGVTKELEYRANMCSALDYILRIANSDISKVFLLVYLSSWFDRLHRTLSGKFFADFDYDRGSTGTM